MRRSAAIDSMRGVCVLLVVLDHIDLRFRIKQFDVGWLAPDSVRQILFHSGYFAVITFFVISGFLITSISRERWSSLDRIGVTRFYWLRLARIGPCLVLLEALLSVLHRAQISEFTIKPERGTLDQAALAALTFHINWLEGRQGYLPGSWDILWSLSVEEVFYLAFPLVCLLCRKERWTSYEIYLWHMLAVLGLIPFVVKSQPVASIPIWYFAFLLSSVALGLTVQKFYSEPMNRFLRARRAAHAFPDNIAT